MIHTMQCVQFRTNGGMMAQTSNHPNPLLYGSHYNFSSRHILQAETDDECPGWQRRGRVKEHGTGALAAPLRFLSQLTPPLRSLQCSRDPDGVTVSETTRFPYGGRRSPEFDRFFELGHRPRQDLESLLRNYITCTR
jgi:hypothetical protein